MVFRKLVQSSKPLYFRTILSLMWEKSFH